MKKVELNDEFFKLKYLLEIKKKNKYTSLESLGKIFFFPPTVKSAK